MSLDIYLKARVITTVYDSNVTHNLTEMWDRAEIYNDLYNSEGKKAKEVVNNLKKGFEKMRLEPDVYIALEPSNGWGDYTVAMNFLGELIRQCELYPNSIVHISK